MQTMIAEVWFRSHWGIIARVPYSKEVTFTADRPTKINFIELVEDPEKPEPIPIDLKNIELPTWLMTADTITIHMEGF